MNQKVDSYTSSSSEYDEPSSWISWHCDQPENAFLCEVDYTYIESAFNLFGLKKEVNHYARCRDIIMEELESSASDGSGVPLKWENEGSARLYGLIHVRYLNTAQGQRAMKTKFSRGHFGNCPLYTCRNQKVLPIGLSDKPGEVTVKVYCPRCQDVYESPNSQLDGAFFGKTFLPFFLLCHPEVIPKEVIARSPPFVAPIEPTIFGYKIHKSSPYWQRRRITKQDVSKFKAKVQQKEDEIARLAAEDTDE